MNSLLDSCFVWLVNLLLCPVTISVARLLNSMMPQRSDLAMFSTDLLFRLVIASPPPHHPILHRDCRVYWPMYHAFQLPGVDCALGERIGPCQEPYGQFICTPPSRLMGPRVRCLLRLGRSCNARQACPAPAGRNACVACIAANTHRPIGVTTESSQIFGTREYIKQQRPRPLQRVVLAANSALSGGTQQRTAGWVGGKR